MLLGRTAAGRILKSGGRYLDEPRGLPSVSNGRRVLELTKELQDSLGQEVLTALQTLSWTAYTFQANHHDLRELLAFVEDRSSR